MNVINGRLRYSPPCIVQRRPVLRFDPEGLTVVNRDGPSEVLSWETAGGRWRLEGTNATRANRAGLTVTIASPTADRFRPWTDERTIWLPSTWTAPPLTELPALVAYLAATPAARTGLASPDACSCMVDELLTGRWRFPARPPEPVLGDRLDIYVAVDRALDSLHWRRFEGRPVRGELRPDAGIVRNAARRLLTCGVSSRVTDDTLTAAVEQHLRLGCWPFDRLLQPGP